MNTIKHYRNKHWFKGVEPESLWRSLNESDLMIYDKDRFLKVDLKKYADYFYVCAQPVAEILTCDTSKLSEIIYYYWMIMEDTQQLVGEPIAGELEKMLNELDTYRWILIKTPNELPQSDRVKLKTLIDELKALLKANDVLLE
jgi:hypothetical protein